MQKFVKILSAALDEADDGEIILRGRIDPDTFDAILVDDYQREVLPAATINQIMKGFEKGGSVPDVDLGMRGMRTITQSTTKGETYHLKDPVYVIDGMQRVTAARNYFAATGKRARLGAVVHFNTTRQWERARFKILNSERVKVSPNVHLRNLREDYQAVANLYSMCENDSTFAMKGRVCWQQSKQRTHLITAATLIKSISMLHYHLGTGLRHITNTDLLAQQLEKVYLDIGKNTFRDNVRLFYQLIEDCWGIRTVTYSGAPHIKTTFLLTLARLLANYDIFWKGNKLFIDVDLTRKFKSFPIQDPTVQQLAGAGGQAPKMLYALLIDHLNKGKRTKRLKPRIKGEEEMGDIELPQLESSTI